MIRNTENQHIVLTYPTVYPSEQIESDLSEFEIEGLKIKPNIQDTGMYAAMEWIIPTALVAYIFKPYYEAFLQEAGKDHYNLVKAAIKKYIEKGKKLDVKIITANQSTEKLDKNYSQSHAVSICFQSKNNRTIKLMFDSNLELTEWNSAIDQTFELLKDNYENYPNDKLTELTKDLEQRESFLLYVIINKKSNNIEIHDDKTMMKLQQNNTL